MNTFKTFFLLMLLSGILVAVGGAFGGTTGIIIALVFAVALNFFAYWSSDKIALKMAHAHPVTEQENPELYSIVSEQASLAGLPMPKVYEIQSDSPNAFATGRNPQHATVAVTTGIRRILNRQELGGVLAHEMAHVGNRDTLIMAVVATIAGRHLHAGLHGPDVRHLRRLWRRRPRPRRQYDWPAGHRHSHAPGPLPWSAPPFPAPGSFKPTQPAPTPPAMPSPWPAPWKSSKWAARPAP